MYPSVYSVDDNRVAGVGTVAVTNTTTYKWDADPFYVQSTWTMTFTDDPLPFADECGVEDDFFTTPADVNWASPTDEWILAPLATIDLVHTVQDDRVDGVGLVTVTATASTNVGAGPVVTTQSWELTFTNAACGGATTPPALAITGASASAPAIGGLLLLAAGAPAFIFGLQGSRAGAR